MANYKDKEDIFFTIIPHQTGFTDQLNQFSAIFRLGHYLGYKYYHTDFSSPRSTFSAYNFQPTLVSKIHYLFQILRRKIKYKILGFRSEDIFNLLGINSYLRLNNPELRKDKPGKVWVNLNTDIKEIQELRTFSQIVEYVTSKVNSNNCKEKIVIFKIEKGRSFLAKIISNIPPHPCQYGLRNEYLKLREKNNWTSRYENSRFRILVHIRLGDTSIIKTPWNTYISSWAIYKKNFTETYNKEEIKSPKQIELNDYRSLLDEINSEFEDTAIHSLIFSDGYERAFQRIIRFRENYNLSKKQVRLLMNSRKYYKDKFFRLFDNESNSEVVFGEDLSKLLELVHAIFDSDLIITGTTQGMIINFVSNYFDTNTMPVIAVLYRGDKPDYAFFENQNLDEKFVFIDVENPDYNTVLKVINLKISCSRE